MSQGDGSYNGEAKEEDVEPVADAELKELMGAEFAEDQADPLFLGEVSFLLDTVENAHHQKQLGGDINPVMKKAHQYASLFDAFQNAETAATVRDQLTKVEPKLHPFEIVQLATLVPTSSEEAKVIIPTLADKFDDDELQDVLDGLATLRQT